MRSRTPNLGWQYIIIVLTSGLGFPPLYFNNGCVGEFLATLTAHVQFKCHNIVLQVLLCLFQDQSSFTWIDPLMLQLRLSPFCGIQSPRNCSQSSV
ncbi:hypothetical protein CY35_02G155000 [Sphagnum magellanicum]|nr:hypothetical protein CY35_02G155000 [Sphagnum magellanicum]KAH9572511.1 hypothetical protein CY35_02G155000 [Sphagnum magellanicum]